MRRQATLSMRSRGAGIRQAAGPGQRCAHRILAKPRHYSTDGSLRWMSMRAKLRLSDSGSWLPTVGSKPTWRLHQRNRKESHTSSRLCVFAVVFKKPPQRREGAKTASFCPAIIDMPYPARRLRRLRHPLLRFKTRGFNHPDEDTKYLIKI